MTDSEVARARVLVRGRILHWVTDFQPVAGMKGHERASGECRWCGQVLHGDCGWCDSSASEVYITSSDEPDRCKAVPFWGSLSADLVWCPAGLK